MTVVSVNKDVEARTLTFVAEFDAPLERVWQLWEDPRQLERWWGPPNYPATFVTHDFRVGGESTYYMTTPEGETPRGWWEITVVDAPTRFEFDDGFSDENGERMATPEAGHAVVELEAVDGKTRMTTTNYFASSELLEEMVKMGMEEGMRLAMGQIDDLLKEVSV